MIEQSWEEVRQEFAQVNPTLAALIDELNPPKDCYFLRAKYHYGDEILKQGIFHIPPSTGTKLLPLQPSTVDAKLYDTLGYNHGSQPMFMVLHKQLEIFMTLESRVVPFDLLKPGSFSGIWRLLDDAPASHASIYLWDMTAGARSLFMLPKISETLSHARLKKEFRFTYGKPANMLEHWEVFRHIAQGAKQRSDWQAELLLFSKGWIDRLKDPAWLKLRYYILNYAWQETGFWRNQFTWNLTFSRIQALHRLKPPAHIDQTVQHLFAVATGAVPGFQVALNEDLAPTRLLQDAYVNVYQLKSYAPLILQPAFFKMYEPLPPPVYLSLHYPTAIGFTYKVSERSSTIIDLSDCQVLAQTYLKEIATESLHLAYTPLGEVAQQVKFDFFHAEASHYNFIRQSDHIAKEDPSFMTAYADTNDREFPKNSSFLKGCIRIAKKEK